MYSLFFRVQGVSRVSTGSGSNAGSDSFVDNMGDLESWTQPRSPLGRSILSGRQAGFVSKRQAFVEGSSSGLPLYEAWQYLMLNWLPFLLSEATFGAKVLLMYRWERGERAGEWQWICRARSRLFATDKQKCFRNCLYTDSRRHVLQGQSIPITLYASVYCYIETESSLLSAASGSVTWAR